MAGDLINLGDTPNPPAGSILHLFPRSLPPKATAIGKVNVIPTTSITPNTPVIPNSFRNLTFNTGMLKQVQHDNTFSA
jgi:hypothetical protein